MLDLKFNKQPTDPTAFVLLPQEICNCFPQFSNRGVRIEMAVLAGFCFHYLNWENADHRKEIEYHDGSTFSSPKGTFVVSMLTIAQDLYHRWFDIRDASLNMREFNSFYQRVRRATARLIEEGLLEEIEKIDYSGRKGTSWAIDWIEEKQGMKALPPPNGTVMHSVQGAEEKEEFVNVVDLIGRELAPSNPAEYEVSRFCTSVRSYGRYHDTMNALNTVSRTTVRGERHISTGAFRQQDVGATGPREDASCMMPYIVLDVDRDDVVESHEVTHRLTEQLKEIYGLHGFPVCYTGGRGFHIHIPCGAIGNPVFRSVEDCRALLIRWADAALDEIVDVNLFDPRHLVRMIGSKHHESGLYKTAFTAEEFLMTPLKNIVSMARLPRMVDLHDPRAYPVCPELALSFAEAAERTFWIDDMDNIGTHSGAYLRALQGCAEGEQWHERHVGRNKLLFVAACGLIKRFEHNAQVLSALKEVNERCDPPLPEREVKSCMSSAYRTVKYERGHRYHQTA